MATESLSAVSQADKTIVCTITGITGLMMNRFTDESMESASTGVRAASAAQDRGSALDQATNCLYTDDDGEIIVPQPNILACITEGGSFFKSGRSKITTQRKSIIPAAISFDEVYYYLESDSGWKVDSRPVRIPATGGRIVRHRPMFDQWQLTFEMTIDTDEMTIDLVRQIVDAAGKKVGLGDFRPACKGPFGRFRVDAWDPKD